MGFFSSFTGSDQADAARKAARQQVRADKRAMTQVRSDLEPFRNLLSPEQMQAGIGLATDPQAQLDFLQGNPLFSNLMQQSQDAIFANQAASGKLASGGTQDALQNAFLAQGQDLINQQLNRFNPLLGNMQNAATQSGVTSANLLSGMGAARSAGTIGAANARSAGASNLLGLGMAGVGAFMGSPAGLASSFFSTTNPDYGLPSGGYNQTQRNAILGDL